MLFWRFEAVRAWAASDAMVALTTWAEGMYLKAVENAIAPAEGRPSKRGKITDVDTDDVMEVARMGQVQGDGNEAHADPKGKGKVRADTMEVNKVIVIDEAEGKTEEYDRLV